MLTTTKYGFNFKAQLLGLCLIVFAGAAHADDPIYTGFFGNVALKGYDTVSYFQGNGEPIKGSEAFETQWRGAQWHFSSQANLDAFTAEPQKYAPQYGGYCAWAAAGGKLAKGDPLIYELVGDKLYLNFNKKVQSEWSPNKEAFIVQADKLYPTLVELK